MNQKLNNFNTNVRIFFGYCKETYFFHLNINSKILLYSYLYTIYFNKKLKNINLLDLKNDVKIQINTIRK